MIRITSNRHRRPILESWDIPADVRSQFDYIDWDACDRGEDSVSFVHAYGSYWDLGDMEPGPAMYGGTLPEAFRAAGFDRYVSETFFSGVVVGHVQDDPPYSDDWSVIVGRYFVDDSTDD